MAKVSFPLGVVMAGVTTRFTDVYERPKQYDLESLSPRALRKPQRKCTHASNLGQLVGRTCTQGELM